MTEIVSFRCPDDYKTILNLLVQHKRYKNQTEAILFGLRLLRDYHAMKVKLEEHESLEYINGSQLKDSPNFRDDFTKDFLDKWKKNNL